MGLVSRWLAGIGLSHAVPNFRAAGIVNPSDLAELELSHYEALGVTTAADRKKLFYLVQRIKMAVDEENGSPTGKAIREEEQRMLGFGRERGGGGGEEGGEGFRSGSGSSDSNVEYDCEDEDADGEEEYSRGRHDGEREADGFRGSRMCGRGGRKGSGRGSTRAGPGVHRVEKSPKHLATTVFTSYGHDSSETASASSDSSDLPSPPREDGMNSRGGAVGLDASRRSVEYHAAQPPFDDDDGEAGSLNRSNLVLERRRDQQNRQPLSSQDVGYLAATKKPFPPNVLLDSNVNNDDVNDLRTQSPLSQISPDENRSDNGRTTSRPRLSTTRAAAAAERLSGRRKNRNAFTGGSGVDTEGMNAHALPSNNSRAVVLGERNRTELSEDDSDWDDLIGPSPMQVASAASASNVKSSKSSTSGRARAGNRAVSPDEESNANGNDRSSRKTRPSNRRTSQRIKDKQRAARGQSGLQSASLACSGDLLVENGDDDESVGSTLSVGSSASSISARGRRRSAPVVGGSTSVSEKGRASSNSSSLSWHQTDSAMGPSKARGTVRSEQPRARSRLEELQAARMARSCVKEASSRTTPFGSLAEDEEFSTKSDSALDLSSHSQKPFKASKTRLKPVSRIPNPTVSVSRTGKKRLSTIPAERVAPMSPLLAVSASQLERSIHAKDNSTIVDLLNDEYDDRSTSSRGSRGRSRSAKTGVTGSRSNSQEHQDSLSGGESLTSERSGRTSSASVHPPPSRSHSGTGELSVGDGADASVCRKGSAAGTGSGGRRISVDASNRGGAVSHRRATSTADSSSSAAGRRSRLQTPSTVSPKRTAMARYDSTRSLDSSLHGSYQYDANASVELNESVASSAVYVHGVLEDDSFKTQIMRLRDENAQEHEEQMGNSSLRGEDDDEEDMRIRVIVRKRPMSKHEAARGDEADVIHPLEYDGYGRILVYQPKTRVDLTKEIETLPFAFDNVFDEVSNNSQIYERAVRSLIPGVFEGRWASVFAYGQTGSGKTFTMMGSNLTGSRAGTQDDSNLGLYYLAAQDVFYLANEPEFRHLTIGASLFEIYGGKLFDLLNCRKPIKCLEDHRGKVCFPGLSEHPVTSASELMHIIEAGATNRSTGTTSANADSSRSHAVLQLSLRKKSTRKSNIEHGRLTFIDLAGSERGADTNKASRTTRMEGAEINTSLLALKEVIRALATGDTMTHIPFRGSKLTQVLKESFVGKNSRSVMVACVAPNMGNCEHTLNTLRYADRVKERDSKSGKLTAAVAKASRIHDKSSINEELSRIQQRHLTSLPNVDNMDCRDGRSTSSAIGRHRCASYDPSDDNSHRSPEESATSDDDAKEVHEAEFTDDDSVVLDELLDSGSDTETSPVSANLKSNGHSKLNSSNKAFDNNLSMGLSQPVALYNKESAKSLISTHRAIMAEMLGMVKHEMTLVNCTDADRDTIDEYLVELEKAQDKQLSMISTLREALLGYYGSRDTSSSTEFMANEKTRHAEHADDFEALSDDSFEDLRD